MNTNNDQSPRAGDGKPDNGWIHAAAGHPARPFAEWLNDQRMKDVSQVFHEIMARYCAAIAAAPAAAPAGDERAAFELWLSRQSSPLHLYGLGRDEEGRYGVAIVQAAWWAWQARSKFQAPATGPEVAP